MEKGVKERKLTKENKMGNSDQQIKLHKSKNNEDIFLELNSVKEQLQEVKRRLEEETEKRMIIEKQLENYKKIIPLPDNIVQADPAAVQKAFGEFYHNQLKNLIESPTSKRDEKEKDKNNSDNLDFLIKTVNGENPLNLHFSSGLQNLSKYHSADDDNESGKQTQPTLKESPSRAQVLFETLISS